MYGHGLLLMMIRRSSLLVPDSTPLSVVAPPAPTGFGVAPKEKASGCGLVLKVRRLPRVTPLAFCATSR